MKSDHADHEHEFKFDQELLDEERELLAIDRFRPSPHERAGGASRSYAWLLIIGGLVGLFSSVQLVLSELALIADPNADLACNLNPIVGCGNSLLSWQSHLFFGWPNALIGTAVFGVVFAVGLMFLAGAQVSAWFWQLMSLTVLAGFVFVAWFTYQSVTDLRTLCPWCMVTWAIVLAVGPQTLGRAARTGFLPVGEKVARVLYLERGLITAALFALLILVAVVAFWNQWLLLLGF